MSANLRRLLGGPEKSPKRAKNPKSVSEPHKNGFWVYFWILQGGPLGASSKTVRNWPVLREVLRGSEDLFTYLGGKWCQFGTVCEPESWEEVKIGFESFAFFGKVSPGDWENRGFETPLRGYELIFEYLGGNWCQFEEVCEKGLERRWVSVDLL